MRIATIFVLTACFLTFSVSCAPRGQSTPQSPQTPALGSPGSPPNAGVPTSHGTADSGGGNTFMGKPLESYKVNPRTLESYSRFIKPWLESQYLKGTGVGNAFESILDRKIWYLIPSELKQLSSDKISSAVGSDLQQAALQDLKQVWIDSLLFEKMAPADQAVLIVHELLMGIKLLKFDSTLTECLAFQSTEAAKDPQYCYNNSSNEPRGKPSDLTPNAYAQIRSAAALISERGQKLTLKDLEEIIGSQGFINISVKKTVSLEQIGRMLEASKLMKTWPTFGFDLGKYISENQDKISNPKRNGSFTLKSDVSCDADVVITSDTISIAFSENGKRISYASKWTSPIEMHLEKDRLAGFALYSADFSKLKSSNQVGKGDTVVDVTLKFLGDTLMGLDLAKTICLNDECTEYGQGISGYRLLCYTRQTIIVNSDK